MTTAAPPTPAPGAGRPADRTMPPVDILAMVTLALIIASGIYLAAHLPSPAPKGPAVALIAVAGVILVVDVVMLSRIKPFAWKVFWQVAGWALLAYAVIAGILLFVFIDDQTRGFMLVALTVSLVFFAIDIPLLLAFSVARYQSTD
jgi:membrane protein YdbS with pleckstrin-like domain